MSNPIYIDLHVHTRHSPCGKREATAEAMIRRAQAKGLGAIGFADHFTPRPVPGCAFYDHQRAHILADLRAEIARVGHVDGLDVLVGVEADYTLAGQDCIDPETLRLVDHVICAASHFHLPAAPQPTDGTPRAKAALMLQMAREALAVPGVSVWAHPFDCSHMRPLAPILATVGEQELAELVALANKHRVAVEINGGPARREDYREAAARFFTLAHEMGARFTATADAHHPDDFERLDVALAWARELGLHDEDLLTVQELTRFREPARSF
jgi:histidinol phosphatase-like PHP family hydrolase